MLIVNKDGTKQLLYFGNEYWYREWRDDAAEVFKRLDKAQHQHRIECSETWFKDWKKVSPEQYFKLKSTFFE